MFRIHGIVATVADPTAASRIALVDDVNIKKFDTQGYVLGDLDNKQYVLCDFKGVANSDGTIGGILPEPIKTRHGLSAYFDNVVAGSVCVYSE
jgi:hypothetical protein